MGLFSLFRKDKPVVADDEAGLRVAIGETPPREDDAAQRASARAIVLKIDAIEAAMTADMFDEPAFRRPPRPPIAGEAAAPWEGPATEWLDDDDVQVDAAPAIEEAAILHANGQADEACLVLASAVAAHPAADRTAWWMLFDLYQLLGRRDAFDSLAIDYAGTFDTPPPSWDGTLAADAGHLSGVIPAATVAGMLDAGAAEQVAVLLAAAEGATVLRLDVARIAGVTPEGCALLHDALRQVQQGRELIVAGIDELLAHVRATVDVGRRADGEAPWWLLLELLRLAGSEKAFNETAMDYGVTFGVAPVPFAPPGKVSTVPREAAAPVARRYLLPRTIEGDAGALWSDIEAYAKACVAPVLDCSRLARIDYAAAGHLLSLLRRWDGLEKQTEFRSANHAVAALLRLLGLPGSTRMLTRRY